MGSKYCALAINSIWNLYFAAYICSQPNKISVICFVSKDKMLQDKAICCGFRALGTKCTFHFKFDYFRQLNRKCNLSLKFTPCLFFWRLIHSALDERKIWLKSDLSCWFFPILGGFSLCLGNYNQLIEKSLFLLKTRRARKF